MDRHGRHDERIPLYLGAMLIALAAMTTNICDVHAWGCGIEKWAPWKKRVAAAVTTVRNAFARFASAIWTDHRRLVYTAAVLAVLMLLQPHAAHAGVCTAVVAGGLDLKALRSQREKVITDMRGVLDTADTEKRALTSDDNAKLERMRGDALALKQRITAEEELEAEERAIVPETQRQAPVVDERTAKYRTEFRQFVTSKEAPSTISGVRQVSLGKLGSGFQFDLLPEQRSQNTLSLAAGGAAVAPDTSMYGRIVEALKFFGGMEAVGSEIMTTDTGADLPIATDDDTSNTGSIVAEEGSQASGTNVTMGQVTLHAFLYSSKVVKVSWQLLQDASFDIESYLGRKLGMRLGRIQNTHFTTGTGTGQPQGLVTAASVGRQSATGNTTSVQADDVKRLVHSVDVAYRNPGCRFMMADATALAFELLKDGNGQYLWRDNGNLNALSDGVASSLAGYKVVINNDMPAIATSAKHTSFGDHSFYKIRRVRAIQLVRINELYVENGQVGFLAFMRADGGLVDAGQHPVKLLQNSAS